MNTTFQTSFRSFTCSCTPVAIISVAARASGRTATVEVSSWSQVAGRGILEAFSAVRRGITALRDLAACPHRTVEDAQDSRSGHRRDALKS